MGGREFIRDPGDGTEFNWNTPVTVTVTAMRDADAVEEAVVLAHRWASDGPVVKMVTVNVDELDTKGVTVSKTDLEVGEGMDASNTYTLALNSAPAIFAPATDAEVTVTISSSSPDVTVNPAQMTFTTGTTNNWATAQPVTVTAVGDDDAEPNASVTLSHTVRGADYGTVRPDKVKVTVREEDMLGIIVMDTAMLPTMEGESGTYTVKLEFAADGNGDGPSAQ